MSTTTRDPWGAASGFAALAVGAAAMVFEEGGPPPGTSDAQVAAFFGAHAAALLAQSLLFLVGAAFLLWFLGALRARLAVVEGGPGRYAEIVFGAGTAYVALTVVAQAGQVALARVAASAAAPQLVAAVADLVGALFVVVAVPAAVTLGAFAVLALRSTGLPSWLGVLAGAAAIAQVGLLAGVVVTDGVFAPTGAYSLVPYPLYVLWLAATAGLLAAVRPRAAAAVDDE
ncbi:hypothetical protein [Pseudonocardia oceani]|uniref:hypothetical protein n=1 Tax=Pseudonocardia oceani TaxID=2792013 RepID=UPI001CECC6B5|nr:hypothetical protein [Pseudonocardia oceani]